MLWLGNVIVAATGVALLVHFNIGRSVTDWSENRVLGSLAALALIYASTTHAITLMSKGKAAKHEDGKENGNGETPN
jgi:hypothetical protein